MTSKPPTRKLVDILKQNSSRVLQQHSTQLTQALSKMPEQVSQTRFLRNAYLISPKSLCILSNASSTLYPWQLFAVYKPPFCPMRRLHAKDNYHNVSIQSFVSAALKSTDVMPSMQMTLRPSEVHVRVLYDLDQFTSGPIVISLCDKHSFATSLHSFTMQYDVLVAGHLPLREYKTIPAQLLYPPNEQQQTGLAQQQHNEAMTSQQTSISTKNVQKNCNVSNAPIAQTQKQSIKYKTECSYEVRRNVYYRAHSASLLNVKIVSPLTPLPPKINEYVRTHLNSFVLGDPHAVQYYISGTSAQNEHRYYTGGVLTRGDFDFPRVFTHLRQVSINVADEQGIDSNGSNNFINTINDIGNNNNNNDNSNSSNQANIAQTVTFHCYKCFQPQLKNFLSTSYKARMVNLFDGMWTPQSEKEQAQTEKQ